MGWTGSPPAPDPRIGQAIDKQSELAQQQFDWSKDVYNRDVLPAMQRDADLREELQGAYLGSMRKQDEYADYQFGRYRDTFAPLEDSLVTEAKRGVNVEGRVGRAVADFAQQDSDRERQMLREMGRMGFNGGDTASTYAATANKNAGALGRVGLAAGIRSSAEGEDFARRAAVAGMGRGLVMDTGNFMQGANAAGGAAGGSSAQGMGVMGQGTDFMRGGYGMSNNMYAGAGSMALGLSNYNMQGYQARQAAAGAAMGAIGGMAGMAFGAPVAGGGSLGGNFFGKKADGGLITRYADGGEVEAEAEPMFDAHELATNQINAVLGLKAGGAVRRPPKVRPGATTQRGGKVSGPGGPKDDRIPALLSDGEFVMPVGAVKKFGVDKMEKMRQAGLEFEKQLGIGR